MKAKVIETGEIVEVNLYCDPYYKEKGQGYDRRGWYEDELEFIRSEKVEEVKLTNEKIKWSPSKNQMEALKDMLKWNIGDFNYQKWMEVNSLYEDLTNSKLFDETDRQKQVIRRT